MTLSQNKEVVFYEFTHNYLLHGERILTGVTTLMKKHGLSPDYSGISEEVLAHAAELGTQAHKAIESYCDGLPVEHTPLIKTFKKVIGEANVIATEYLVSDNECIASSVDLIAQTSENEVILIDMKRTDKVHTSALEWQLGIYKYLFEKANPDIKVSLCFCLPIKKGAKDSIEDDTCKPLVAIEPKSLEEVEALLTAEKEGRIYESKEHIANDILSYEGQMALKEGLIVLADLESKMKEAKESVDRIKERYYEYMLENNVETLKGEGYEVKLKRPYGRVSIDSTAFKKELPEVYEKYQKETLCKGSVIINII